MKLCLRRGKEIIALMLIVFIMLGTWFTGCTIPPSFSDFSFEDLVWTVEEEDYEGEKTVLFSYENKSPFTITGVEVEFRQKTTLTEDQLSILNKYDKTKEELSKFYITAYNYYYTQAGTQSKVVPCSLVGSWNYCHDIEEYNIMEPVKMVVSYIKEGKMFGKEYDFATQKTKELTEAGVALFEWTESVVGDIIPKPNKEVVHKKFDFGTHFSFTVYDATEKDFIDYIEKCKEVGFILNVDENDYLDYKSYKAEDMEGNEVHIYYQPVNHHREPCCIQVSIQGKGIE